MRWTGRGEGMALLAVAIFAGTFPATRLAVLGGISPLANGVVRSAIAGILAGITLVALRATWPTPSERWYLVVIGLSTLSFPIAVGWAVHFVPAGHAAVAMTLLPLVAATYAAWRGQSWPGARFWYAGLVAAILVGIFAIRHSHTENTTPISASQYLLAGGAILMAMVTAAVTYVEGGLLSRRRPAWQVISWSMVSTLPCTALWSWWWLLDLFPVNSSAAISPSAWAGLLYGGVFSAWVGFFPWYTAIATIGVARAGHLQYLQPFLSLGYGVILLHEACGALDLALAAGVVGVIAWGRGAFARTPTVASLIPARPYTSCPPSSLPAEPATSAPTPSSNC